MSFKRRMRKRKGISEIDKCYLCNNKAQDKCPMCFQPLCNRCMSEVKPFCYKCYATITTINYDLEISKNPLEVKR